MKSVLLGLTVSAFAFSSALAGGCFGSHQKTAQSTMIDSTPKIAQSQPVKKLEFAKLKDAWLIEYLT